MPDYKAMYFALAAQVADALETLERALLDGEAAYAENDDAPHAQTEAPKA